MSQLSAARGLQWKMSNPFTCGLQGSRSAVHKSAFDCMPRKTTGTCWKNVLRLVMFAQYHQTVPLSFYEVTHAHTPGACGYIYGYTTRQQTDVTIKMAETMTELTTRRRFKSLRSFAALLPNISLVSSDWLIGDRPFCGRQTRRIFLHMRTSSYAHAHV